jgi:hypothetical protein
MSRPKNHSNILIIKELAERVGFEAPPILKTKQLVENIALTFCNNRTFRKGLTHELTRQEVRPVPNLSLGTMSTCQSYF